MHSRFPCVLTVLAASQLLRPGEAVRGRYFLPLRLQCWNTPQYWKAGRSHGWGDARGVWRALGLGSGYRADSTCCSSDKARTVLDYAEAILGLKTRSLEDQEAFAQTLARMVSRSDLRDACRGLVGRALQQQIDAHSRTAGLARRAFPLLRSLVVLTLRAHCLLPRGVAALMASERSLRRAVRRLARLNAQLAEEARALAAACASHAAGEGASCFPAPFLVSTAGAEPPGVTRESVMHAITYPFSRSAGAVQIWHAWIDRFSLVFTLLPGKLTHAIKAITSGFEAATLHGPSRETFWGDRLLVEPGAYWRWPNHGARADRDEADPPSRLVLVLLVSNRTCADTVDGLWSETELLLDATEGRMLRVVWLEDSVRDAWVTAERPVHAAWLSQSARNLAARRGAISRGVTVVWRRHQNTLDNLGVARAYAGGGSPTGQRVLVYDARNSGSGDTGCSVAGAAAAHAPPGGGLAPPLLAAVRSLSTHEAAGVAWPSGMSLAGAGLPAAARPGTPDGPRGSLAWATAGLGEYLAWHRRALGAWRAGGPSSPRALVYVCSPFSLCGGHGDRTNGILSAFLLAVLTSRAFFIDLDSPLPLGLALQPRRSEDGGLLLDWRLRGGAAGSASHNSYIDDRVAFQEDLAWLAHDRSRTVLVSMNHRELGALLSHPTLRARAEALGLRRRPHLYARLWATLFEAAPPLRSRLQAAREELGLGGPLPWASEASGHGFLAIHFRAGNESARSWWDPGRHPLSSLQAFLDCAGYAERELGLPSDTRWFLSADTQAALQSEPVAALRARGKLALLGEGWRIAHVDRSSASLGFEGFVDSYAAYFLVASARAVVLSRSYFGETAAEIGAAPDAYFAEGCVRADLSAS